MGPFGAAARRFEVHRREMHVQVVIRRLIMHVDPQLRSRKTVSLIDGGLNENQLLLFIDLIGGKRYSSNINFPWWIQSSREWANSEKLNNEDSVQIISIKEKQSFSRLHFNRIISRIKNSPIKMQPVRKISTSYKNSSTVSPLRSGGLK